MPQKTAEARREYQRVRNLRRRYNMTAEQYDQMFFDQGGKCKLCGYKNHRALHVDHCHETKVNRGLLCSCCNRKVVGAIEKIGLDKIASYLGYDIYRQRTAVRAGDYTGRILSSLPKERSRFEGKRTRDPNCY